MNRRVRAVAGLVFGFGMGLVVGAAPAQAQVIVGQPTESVSYDVVQPGYKTVTYGEKIKTRRFFNKTVTVEKPRRFVSVTPPVVQETRVVRPAPVTQQVVVQPEPVVQERWIQPAPVLERRVVQPPPVVQTRVIQQDPVVQTRYVGSPPY